MRLRANSLLLGVVLCLLAGCEQPPMDAEPGVSLALAEQRAANVSHIQYELRLKVPREAEGDIDGHVVISFDLKETNRPLQLDFRESPDKIRLVLSNGQRSAYQFVNEHVVVPAKELRVGRNTIMIDFTAGPTSLNRNPEYLYTLFVPDRARTAFPLFDQPDLKAVYLLSLEVPADWKAMANAPLDKMTGQGESVTYEFLPTEPISSYLFSFVAGKFESISRERDGRTITMLHRETDPEKLERNLDTIFDLHAAAIEWMEDYTGIDYPYQKFGFALIPAFQYGGMEHVGAILYRASSLLLDETPSDTQLLDRAALIAHETAHMWFGDLVTMRWFNDVWTKEVFANFMAAKIVNPGFPEINHPLSFLVDHYPAAYSVDRTDGANAIRQHLDNLNQAGQMYGSIIYNKAPIMMRQLEAMTGEEAFREGMQEYLNAYAFGNATWPDLIAILDRKSEQDLQAWSEVWVNTPGRPRFEIQELGQGEPNDEVILAQVDPAGDGRVWPQRFDMADPAADPVPLFPVLSESFNTPLAGVEGAAAGRLLFNADGFGYGLFPADVAGMRYWLKLDELQRGALLVNLWEQMLADGDPRPQAYFFELQSLVAQAKNQLLLDLILAQLRTIYWNLIDPQTRQTLAVDLQAGLWQAVLDDEVASRKKIRFDSFASIAITRDAVQKVYAVWNGELTVPGLSLSERDRIDLAQVLAIKMPGKADQIIAEQMQRTENPDDRRRLEFLAPSVSASQEERDAFFASLALEENRQVESWVLEALANLHHPLRVASSERYLPKTLELLEEVQVTGDIFFPKGWLDASLRNYNSASAVEMVETFLEEHPDYNPQLRMKLLQAADPMFRARRLLFAPALR